ncbi:MAG TPA: TatD family hydrolase [Gammaproteobacteria bacterium]
MIDIGVNLTGSAFHHDIAAVIERAAHVGVTTMVVTGTDVEHSQAALELTQQFPQNLYATAGVHPHHASECNDKTLAILEQLAQHEKVVAIGECGLDFNRDYSPRDVQEKWFEAQLELASGLQLPVFLHQRDAHERFLGLMQHWRPKLMAAVAHCFTGNMEEAQAYIDLDMHIGVTGWICDERRGESLQQAVKHIPENRLMLETDAPYLLPRDLQPKPKDRRNEPMYLPHICQVLAGLRNQDVSELARMTTATSREFFRLLHEP